MPTDSSEIVLFFKKMCFLLLAAAAGERRELKSGKVNLRPRRRSSTHF
jgi:hypothetical protein